MSGISKITLRAAAHSCLALLALVFLVVLLIYSWAGCSVNANNSVVDKETLFQVSTINALMAGSYDGVMSLEALGKYGDFGIGTLERLDGEMIETNGRFYQVRV